MPIDMDRLKYDFLVGLAHGWLAAILLLFWTVFVEVVFGPVLDDTGRSLAEATAGYVVGGTVSGIVLGLLARKADAWWKASLVGGAVAVPAYGSLMFLWSNEVGLFFETTWLWIPIGIMLGLVAGPIVRAAYRSGVVQYWL